MKGNKPGELILTLFFLAFFVILIAISMTYSPKARRMPLVVMVPGLVLCTGLAAAQALAKRRPRKSQPAKETKTGDDKASGLSSRDETKRMLIMFGWMILLVGMIWVVGFLVTIPVYTLLFMRSLKESWRLCIIFAVCGFIVLYLLFVVGLNMELYPGLVFQP